MNNFLIGIDEAGRGPVLGPMVMAICVIPQNQKTWLNKNGITDSKKLSSKKRDFLAKEIKQRFWYKIFEICPDEIDKAVNNIDLNLNGLEIIYIAKLIKEYQAQFNDRDNLITIDSLLRDTDKLTFLLKSKTNHNNILSQNKADEIYQHVGAASIIAKSRREEILKNLRDDTGIDFGSGYPSDPKTKQYVVQAQENDPLIRWTWKTCSKLRK